MTHEIAMMDRCAQICHECQDVCLTTIIHCLDMGGKHVTREHQTVLSDCIAACGFSHNVLHRHSPQHVHSCRACAAICTACAESCEQFGDTDDRMKECAEMCRRCAESCTEMAGVAA